MEIGQAVERYRLFRGLSQKTLSDEMKALGWKWSQPTVVAIEKGERGLKLDELPDLIRILELESVLDFFSASAVQLAGQRFDSLQSSTRSLRRAALSFYKAKASFRRVLESVNGEELLIADEELNYWLTLTAEDVVSEVSEDSP